MDEEPERQGKPVLHYTETATEEQLRDSGEFADNEVVFTGDGTVFLYEAPANDDPLRGHRSTWEKTEDGTYERVYDYSGLDGDVYRRFKNDVADV